MRVFVQRSHAFAIFSLAALLAGRALAQPAEEREEITVRGKSPGEYRLELERARDEVFRQFNEANKGDDTDVTCRDEQPTGSRMPQNVCRSAAEKRADANAAHDFLGALLRSAGNYITGIPNSPPGTQVIANINTAVAQTDAKAGAADALAKFEQEWTRLLEEDRQFYRAVVKYVELENEYNKARGVADQALQVPAPAVTAAQPRVPQCEASMLTDYAQRNNVARISGRIGLSACPAGTTGSYTVVARVRNEGSEEIKPIEFSETWQRDDAGDVALDTDYPIGDNAELVSVRIRGLKCTCIEPAQ